MVHEQEKEVMLFCPGCKELQVIRLVGKKMVPVRKFTQKGDHIYHECGSTQPCRIYHNV